MPETVHAPSVILECFDTLFITTSLHAWRQRTRHTEASLTRGQLSMSDDLLLRADDDHSPSTKSCVSRSTPNSITSHQIIFPSLLWRHLLPLPSSGRRRSPD
ncbi:hypothetical protein DENSPDRAFT_628882 [Dentipellis sp. KUC8613]|nr:hypothetical protein DENSPDRAFT_628882 [Dentipellis sp. KUC8613]